MARPKALIMGSYGWRDGDFNAAEQKRANELAFALGGSLIEHDVDIVVGGSFDMAVHIVDGARNVCTARGYQLRDRLSTYHSESYPPPRGATAGQVFRLVDDDAFWTRVLMSADVMIAVSGRRNTATVLELAAAVHKPAFPFGIFPGASRNALQGSSDPGLQWLGDSGLPLGELANRLAKHIQSLYASRPVQEQVFVIMHFSRNRTYNVIVEECAKLKLRVCRADDSPQSSLIIEDIKRLILESEFIIVDLSRERPNVYYELGYAHGKEIPPAKVLLIARQDAPVHFDIAGYRIHRYRSIKGLRDLIQRQFAVMVENRASSAATDTARSTRAGG